MIWITSVSKLTIYTQLSPSFATEFVYKMHINSFTYTVTEYDGHSVQILVTFNTVLSDLVTLQN